MVRKIEDSHDIENIPGGQRPAATPSKRRTTAGDVRQASEKGWGAAVQIVKAIAARRDWEHQGHRELFQAVDRLRRETGDPDVRRLFDVASALHVNFYEDWRTGEAVAEALDDVERFVNKLEPLVLGE